MPSKKLVTLLRSFSRSELNRFEKYLSSPFFNEREEIKSLYQWLVEQLDKNGSLDAATAKQFLWGKIFSKEIYNDAQMRRLLSELIQHALHFLALEHLKTDPVKEHIIILNKLKNSDLDLHFEGILRQVNIFQQQVNTKNVVFYLYQQQIEEIKHYRIERQGYKIDSLENLYKASSYLDCYYISQKLKYYCDTLAHKEFFSIEIDTSVILFFFDYMKIELYLHHLVIRAYFTVALMLLKPHEETSYFELKDMLEKEAHNFDIIDLKTLYTHLINYCIYKKINIGVVEFYLELFTIYKSLVERGILLKENLLDISQHYRNIITVGIQVREFDWTEAFLQEYTPKLPPEERENALTYNLAKVYFAQQHYEKVIEQLREVEYENLTYALGGKLMLLKTYYELNEYLALDSLLDSFRVYLRRNQTISKEVRQQYLNVLRFIKKLSNVHPGDQSAVAKIENQIQECKNLADKGWIVQKVEELRGNGLIGE